MIAWIKAHPWTSALLLAVICMVGLAFWHDWRAATAASTAAAAGVVVGLGAVRAQEKEVRERRERCDADAARVAAEEEAHRTAADAKIAEPHGASGNWNDEEKRPPP